MAPSHRSNSRNRECQTGIGLPANSHIRGDPLSVHTPVSKGSSTWRRHFSSPSSSDRYSWSWVLRCQLGSKFVDGEALILLSGVVTLPVGMAVVIVDIVWVARCPRIIAIIGWLAVPADVAAILAFEGIASIGLTIAVHGAIMAPLCDYLAYFDYLV